MQRMSTTTGSDQEASSQSVGRSEQETRQEQAISQVDAAYIAALHRIADAGNRIADAIEFLARETAGEFEQDDDDFPIARDISGRSI